jgi:non-lysosomal glucosylceramidase
MYDSRENEHQELFHLNVDPTEPVAIHIPSPLGPLGYYVYVRVPAHAIAGLTAVSVQMDVGGLREDHLTIGPDAKRKATASKQAGLTWLRLGKSMVSRGQGTIEFQGWPSDVKPIDVLLCTWPRFVESGMADDWIAAQVDRLFAASGVPLGGIGCGRVDICRDGRFRNFSMNNNQDAPIEDPDGLVGAYLSVSTAGVTKDLASRPIVDGHESCDNLVYDPRFPQATLAADGMFPGLDVKVTLSGLLTPHDLQRSSLPGFIVRWEIKNSGADEQAVRCAMGWPNLVGVGGGVSSAESGIGYGDGFYHHWDDPTGRVESRMEIEGIVGVEFRGTPEPEFIASAGEHVLGVSRVGCKPGARCGSGHGEVFADIIVPAGETAYATMALAAVMPHWVDSLDTIRGHMWQNHYHDGEELIAELLGKADDILSGTGALAEFLDDSTIPVWLQRRLSNCNYPLVSNSVFYKDGRFSVNEGPTEMAGCYGTIDQRLAAHPATQILFPELNRMELQLFTDKQGENGGICHDLGGGNLERHAGEMAWPDLTCSFIIQTARHAWSMGDVELEAAAWPRAKQAVIRHGEWADAGLGVAQVGAGLGTSYDGYHYFGTTGYMATLWLAALSVCEKWATRQNDPDIIADIVRWRKSAIERLDQDLWNGKHYIAYGSETGARRETCHAGQLAGQVFARMLCGRDVLDGSRVKQCVDSLMALNGSDRFAIPPDEVNSDGSAATDFGWLPYVEGFMLSAVGSTGDERVWSVWERMMNAVDADGASPCDTRLMYLPEEGKPSWGWCYMTAPASWLVYDSIMDFFFTASDGALRLRTTTPGRFPLVHPLFWATVDIDATGGVTLTIKKSFGKSHSMITKLDVPTCAGGVMWDGVSLVASEGQGDYKSYALPSPLVITEGEVLKWQVK